MRKSYKSYTLHRFYGSKVVALKVAKELREKGYNAHVAAKTYDRETGEYMWGVYRSEK